MTPPARKLLPFVFLLAAAFPPQGLTAGVGEWTSSGPHGGSIVSLAADPSNPATLYAATDRQVYKSVDGGQSWAVTFSGRFDVLLPTSDPSVVYVTGVYHPTVHSTADGGGHWVGHSTPVSGNPLVALAVDPQDPRTLYALVWFSAAISGLYRSTNGAESWELIPNPPSSGIGLTGIAVDPADSAVLYISVANGTVSSGIYRSSNRGGSWTLTALKEPSSRVVVDPGSPSRIFALGSAGVQLSTDAGASWRRIFPGSAVQFPTDLAVDPANSSRLYAIAGGALFYSSDGGASSTQTADNEFGGLVQAIAVSSSGAVFAGSRTGIYRSEDAAVSWGGANGGISEIQVDSIAVDPTDPAVVFAASPQGIHVSRDRGASWSRPTSESPSSETIAIDPTNRSILYAAGIGVQKSTDGGRTWANPSSLADRIYDLVIDPNNPRRILASSWNVYRSSNGAESWSKVLTPDDNYSSYYYPPTVNALAIAPSDSSTLYAGGQGFSATDYHSIGLFYRSGDGGDHWTAMASPGADIRALAVDSCDPRIVLAAELSTLYRSTDGGGSWTGKPFPSDSELPPGFANAALFTLARDPRHSSSIFAGTSEGIFWTNDRGVTWTRFEPALREPVRSIALDSSGRFLYAGTERGVFGIERSFEPCSNGPDRLCLLGGKYEASLIARRRGTAVPFPGRAIEEGDRFGYFSFPDVTGDPTFPEVFIKMLDASNAPPPYGGAAWVFHSSLTDLDYTLTVRETESGRVRIYTAAHSGPLSCGVADTTAFARACEATATATATAPETEASFESPSGAELSFLGGRFRATVRATDPRTGRVVDGAAYPRADGFGYFGLPGLTGDPAFPEIFVKMADGRQNGGHFWVFHTGLTDLDYVLTIRDTQTGVVKTYPGGATNGTQLCGSADTSAF